MILGSQIGVQPLLTEIVDRGKLVDLISKVCDLQDRDEKWELLRTLNQLLAIATYPPRIAGNTDSFRSL